MLLKFDDISGSVLLLGQSIGQPRGILLTTHLEVPIFLHSDALLLIDQHGGSLFGSERLLLEATAITLSSFECRSRLLLGSRSALPFCLAH